MPGTDGPEEIKSGARNPGTPWHSTDIAGIFEKLNTGKSGLTAQEAESRLREYGSNKLKAAKKTSLFILFLSQFNNFLIYILLGAIGISVFIGEVINAEVIAIIVILNAILGFIQEYKAEKSIESLQGYIVQRAYVIRDGHKIEIKSENIVPGDIIEIEAGENVPADARLIEAHELKTDDSALTGESEAQPKEIGVSEPDASVADRQNMVYMGTSTIDGRGKGVVINTGMNTEIGRIARLVEEGKEYQTPIQISLEKLGRFFGIAAIVVCVIIFIIGVLEGRPYYDMFLTAVSLAVAAIPEGLPATITIVLALGVQRMAKRKAIIRKLPAVETLGSVNVICSDKTGTLTQDIIMVKKLITYDRIVDVSGRGYEPKGEFTSDGKTLDPTNDPGIMLLLKAGTLGNNATYEKVGDKLVILGDSTEVSLLVASAKAGISKVLSEDSCPRQFEVPFSADTKKMSTLNACEDGKYLYMKGAPEVVMENCISVFQDGKDIPFDKEARERFHKLNFDMASSGMRVLGFAYKRVENDIMEQNMRGIESSLTFIGLAGMIDPPRPEAKDAIHKCKDAGIDVKMITGDQPQTATSIARQLDFFNEGDMAITGKDLEMMPDSELDKKVKYIKIFARTSPEQKLKIIESMKRTGKVVAMTGDGVNDAPALKKADIGIAMGITGTDVSREASDMVLADDNFATIVSAIEEGRAIFDNIRKFVKFLFSGNLSEILVIGIGLLLNLPLPLLAIQILWINLITDGLPALALSFDPAEGDLMKRKPRPGSEGIITKKMLMDIGIIGTVIAIGTLGVFYYYYHNLGLGLEIARTMAFSALVLYQLFNSLNCRSEDKSIFHAGIFKNKYLIMAILFSLLLQFVIIYVPFMNRLFVTMPITVNDWLILIIITLPIILVVEIRKLITRKKKHMA